MTIYRCDQMKPSYSYKGSGKKPYIVVPFPKGALPSCTCTGFMTKRNKNANLAGGGFKGAGVGLAGQVTAWCKHLEHYSKTICQWEMDDRDGSIVPDRCPRCSGPIAELNGKVKPDVSSATNGLLAIVADLSGKQVIDQDDEPEPDDEPDEVLPITTAGTTNFDVDAATAELAAMLKGK